MAFGVYHEKRSEREGKSVQSSGLFLASNFTTHLGVFLTKMHLCTQKSNCMTFMESVKERPGVKSRNYSKKSGDGVLMVSKKRKRDSKPPTVGRLTFYRN